jgi:hypothetical protein
LSSTAEGPGTTGTHVPQGGASPRGPGSLREWPAVLVFACLTVSLLVGTLFGFRPATIMIAVTLALAAVLRLAVRDVGILAVRGRLTDVVTLVAFAGAVLLLGLSVPPAVVDLPWVPRRTG